MQQLFPEKYCTMKIQSANTFTGTTITHQEENIRQMCAEIKKHELLQLQPSTNKGIINFFSGQIATREQANDMLNCLQIDNEPFQAWYKHNIQSDNFDEQFSIYPRALVDEHGFPHKKAVPGLINCKIDIKLQNPLSLLTVYFGHQMQCLLMPCF